MSTRKAYKRKTRCHRGRNRAERCRTFSSEAKAKLWAEKLGLKNYTTEKVNGGLSDKIKLVSK